jgi:hypothetical protein
MMFIRSLGSVVLLVFSASASAAGGEEIRAAIHRGVEHLVATQNPDGSWGGPQEVSFYPVAAQTPGSFYVFREAVTALACTALLECLEADLTPDPEQARAALEKGMSHLLGHCEVKRATYQNWTYGYALPCFVQAYTSGRFGEPEKERIREKGERMIELLARYQELSGGWAYYVYGDMRRHYAGGSGSTSFMTSTVLVSLAAAREAGWDVPPQVLQSALRCLGQMRNPDGTYLYSLGHRRNPVAGVSRLPGSISRMQPGNLALYLHGKEVEQEDLQQGIEHFLGRHHRFLRTGYKTPEPHSNWYAISSYYYLYSHYYASRIIELLPKERQEAHWAKLAEYLLADQEKDGSWWDCPIVYNYHKPYGTAFALMALSRCEKGMSLFDQNREGGEGK